MTQGQVGERLGVHPVTVSKWERGLFAPEENQLSALATLYGFAEPVLRYGDVDDPASLSAPAETGERAGTLSAPVPIDSSASAVEADAVAERVLRTHAVRVWLADFRSALTKARATEEEIARALRLLTSPSTLTFYSKEDGGRRAFTEEDAILALEALAVPIRAELRRRGRKFG